MKSSGDTADTSVEEQLPDESLDLDQFWDAEWKKNLIDAAIERVKAKVNPKQYKIFHLHVVKKLSVKDVAKAMGVNVAQVYLARHRVSKLIEKEVRYLESKMI
jgi:RNA polymerase sigma-70 factor (ECF subfamily)